MDQLRQQVLLVEDQPEQAELLQRWLIRDLAVEVTWAMNAGDALRLLGCQRFDLVLSDIELPGMSGIEFVRAARRQRPLMAIVLITAHARFEYALSAVRAGADEFLVKPIERDAMINRVGELLSRVPSQSGLSVLAIGAHPDDIELGCGGTLLRHAAAGDRISLLTLSNGEVGGEAAVRLAEAQSSAALLGAGLFVGGLADTAMGVDMETIRAITEVTEAVKPTIVYTHSSSDTHQDHSAVHHASVIACRRVGNLFCYQSPSATVEFSPSLFIDITPFVEGKRRLIDRFVSQAGRRYLQAGVIEATALYWGRFADHRHVEPLEVIRAQGLAAHPTIRPLRAHPSSRPQPALGV